MMPFGEYKGYGLQFVSELLGAVLTGSRLGLEGGTPPSPNGILAIALNPEAFVGLEAFKEKTDELITKVKAVKPQKGKRVQTPGEPEWETKFKRLEEGISLPDETWGNIVSLAKGLGIEVEE